MQPSIFLEPAFFAGFAACFVLMAIVLLLFLIFAPLHEAEADIEPAHQPTSRFSRAARGRQAKADAHSWGSRRPSAWDEQNNCHRGPR
jgi:hypothetical protein